MSQAYKQKSIKDCLRILARECRVRRLIQEDTGVLAPLWFGRDPDSHWHVFANILRVFVAIPLAPLYIMWRHVAAPWKQMGTRVSWNVEWAHVPDAMIFKSPGAGLQGFDSGSGEYAVTNSKPRWLLEIHFKGGGILSERQVPYDGGHMNEAALSRDGFALQKAIQDCGYTAISYPMKSVAHMYLNEAKRRPDPSSEAGREFSLANRQLMAHMVLECYAEARASIPGKADGVEYIWMDEFCLSDAQLPNSTRHDKMVIKKQRALELGQLADIFRSAKQVVVFCPEPRCDHTNFECAWGKRLFTLGEIMHAEEVYQMTRRPDPESRLVSTITILPGYEFRGTMQARAARDKQWHLYNIMQHSTNSGSVNWQSAIHSLVVEAIRRDEADGFHLHNMLGKALNGLLPRRSQLEDLQGVDGWADLAWLLELNQGFYNAAALAAVCQLADPWVGEYRWWGRPIKPQEGRERLEPLSTAIPAKFRNDTNKTVEPVLSIVGPRSAKVKHMLRRDDSALYRNADMRILKNYAKTIAIVLGYIGLFVFIANVVAALAILYFDCIAFTVLELLVGTIYVKKDAWIVYEDRLFPHGDAIRFLRERDFSYQNAIEWGDRQVIPRWDELAKDVNEIGQVPQPFRVTLVDLRTGVYTKAMVTRRPNNLVVLAVHGGGITCMLLERDEDAQEATVATKVGMANVPPFVLAQADYSGTVYVGGEALCEKPVSSSFPGGTQGGNLYASRALPRSHQNGTSNTLHASSQVSLLPPHFSASIPPTPGTVSSSSSVSSGASSKTAQLSSHVPVIATTPARIPVVSDLPMRELQHSPRQAANQDDFDPYGSVGHGSSRV